MLIQGPDNEAQDLRRLLLFQGVIYSDTAAANYSEGPELFNKIIPLIPQKRLGTVEEVSAAVCYLLSPAAAFVTGETLRVDGGQLLKGAGMLMGPDPPEHRESVPYTWNSEEHKSKSKL